MDSRKSDPDFKMIARLLGFEPLDCARRPNGDLVYLNPAGQKFILTPAELDKLADKAREDRMLSEEPGAAIPEDEQHQPSGSETKPKPRSHHKKTPAATP